ncbi:MAG: hypothetical protein CXT73_05700 [Methanobacteriota archaeon]|nr:MAG: hypothetical protein CXT73_05700 [Euryarchaeota archaeon]
MENLATHKERQDMIVEPLHVMVHLALLNYCPIGTKISISDNTLHLQKPSYVQGVIRWWHMDNKDDLYYLFHAIRRFYLWYKNTKDLKYTYILETAVKGLGKLITTYQTCKNTAITHSLALYKNILEMEQPDLFKETSPNAITMDSVFQNVTALYSKYQIYVIFNTLKILENETNSEYIDQYLTSLESFFGPLNSEIRSWIHSNLSC